MIFGLGSSAIASALLAQDFPRAEQNKIVIISLISAASTSNLEEAAKVYESPENSLRIGDDFSIKASCVVSLTSDVIELFALPRMQHSKDKAFSDFPIFAIIRIDGVTTFKINAGRQVWVLGEETGELSFQDFIFTEGVFRGLVAEKGCKDLN
jgi:hypothetical protein